MKEQEFIKTIIHQIGSDYIGDDCAYLKELGIVITQDSLVEGVHFKREWCTPYQLGYKAMTVNISDIFASGAKPAYVTIALSLPNDVDNKFIEYFYAGAKNALHGADIVGGDITGSSKDIMISITAIGTTQNRTISSRSHASSGYAIITKGNYGTSAAGLNELLTQGDNKELINAHLEPKLESYFSEAIAKNVKEKYAMMDTSDGLADALFKIALSSKVSISVNYDKIPHLSEITKEQVLFGGEDYKLVAAIPPKYISLVPGAVIIGCVNPYNGIYLDISGDIYTNYNQLQVYNHFDQ